MDTAKEKMDDIIGKGIECYKEAEAAYKILRSKWVNIKNTISST
tara:strand:+ start:311 stop:442 length:132 start_codon:yes stop_codon:yes gene_type:complete